MRNTVGKDNTAKKAKIMKKILTGSLILMMVCSEMPMMRAESDTSSQSSASTTESFSAAATSSQSSVPTTEFSSVAATSSQSSVSTTESSPVAATSSQSSTPTTESSPIAATSFQSSVSSTEQSLPADISSRSSIDSRSQVTTEKASQNKKKRKLRNGWVTKKSKKYYYVNDKRVTGWKKIKKNTYYFDSHGVMQKNKMISKNKYVNEKGVLIPKTQIYAKGKNSLKKLKAKLEKQIRKYSGQYCIYVKNLDTNEYMAIHNYRMKTASVIKLYNMGTVYEQMAKKKIKNSGKVQSCLHSMITVSSNDSYNELLRIVGKGSVRKGINEVTAFCKKHGYKNTNAGGTLSPSYFHSVWITSSRSTPQDCGHILEDIYRGNLVSEDASKKMLSLLKKQTRKSKIPAGLPKGVKSANKTGEYGDRQHDAAIVFSKKADYVIVIMSEHDGAAISHIRQLSRMTYDYFN